jgi:hypothetical protein
MSPESIQPGGDGHIACIRVRLLHAAVRKKILTLAKSKPQYFDVESFGVPINDQDTIATISTFSAQLIWLALPAQGIFLKKDEIDDYIALWRLVAWYMGTPIEQFRTAETTKAYMESVLGPDLIPSKSSQVLAGNIISCLADQPPTYPSADYLRSMARFLNGPGLSDALAIPKSSYFTSTLVVTQLFVIGCLSYVIREIPFLDRWKINYMRNNLYKTFILGKDGLGGKFTKFELQYMPEYDTVTEEGKSSRGLAFGTLASTDSKNLIALIVLVGITFGLIYFWAKAGIMLWSWIG